MTVNEKRWAILGLLVNAFVWGVSWWPLRQLNAAGFHPLCGKHVVFGKVVKGMEVVTNIEHVGSESGATSKTVEILDCGVVKVVI